MMRVSTQNRLANFRKGERLAALVMSLRDDCANV